MDSSLENATYSGPAYEPHAVLLAVLSGIALVLVIQPMVWHTSHRNMPAASLICWLLILNLINFTNALIWPNDNIQAWFDGRGVCDIQTKVVVGSYAGIPTALCGIVRSLAIILDSRQIGHVPTPAQRRRELAVQWLLVWACPILLIALHYIVQPNRYYVFAISGCEASFDDSWLSVVLIFLWPPVFSLWSCYYAVLLVWRLHKYRQEFSRIMTLNKTMKSRFVRLFALSSFLILAFVPLSLWVFANNVRLTYEPYSWNRVHAPGWNTPLLIPTEGVVLIDRWFRPAAAFVAFVFFGLGNDAVKMYKRMLAFIGLGRFFSALNNVSITGKSIGTSASNRRLRNNTKISNARNTLTTSHNEGSVATRTSVSTFDSALTKDKPLGSPASLPSPIRLEVRDGGAVAVKTHVSVEEEQKRADRYNKPAWEL